MFGFRILGFELQNFSSCVFGFGFFNSNYAVFKSCFFVKI